MTEKLKPHACPICDYRGRKVKLVEFDFEVDAALHARAKVLAKLYNMSLEKYVRHAIHDYLEEGRQTAATTT